MGRGRQCESSRRFACAVSMQRLLLHRIPKAGRECFQGTLQQPNDRNKKPNEGGRALHLKELTALAGTVPSGPLPFQPQGLGLHPPCRAPPWRAPRAAGLCFMFPLGEFQTHASPRHAVALDSILDSGLRCWKSYDLGLRPAVLAVSIAKKFSVWLGRVASH